MSTTKYREHARSRRVHKLACGAALVPAAACAFGEVALAQEAVASLSVEEIMVTGSRIVRRDANSVGPLTTLTAEEILATAPLGIGDILQTLPAVGVSLNSNGTQGTSFGVSSINLRYLGSVEGSGNRTLVLVDGHRWINAAGGRGFRDFVDLNTIPMGIIDSVEVLKDGASAIYGADAIAGVVNIRTRRDVNGLEATFTGGQTSRSDGRNLGMQLVYGRQFERSSLMLSANYTDIEPIFSTDRRLTERALAPVTSPPTSPRGLYALPGVSTAAEPLTRIPGAAGNSPSDFRVAALPDDDYNTMTQGLYVGGPSERVGLFGRITTEVTESVEFQTELLFNRRQSAQLFSPLLFSLAGGNGYTLPADHPFNPYDMDFAGSAFRIQRIPDEVGNRQNSQDVKTFRFGTGLVGSFEGLNRSWNWDLFGSYSQNEATFTSINQINFDRVALALGPNERCVAYNCVPLDIFGTITPEMADYIRQSARDEHRTTQFNAALNISGWLVDLPAGRLGVAAGLEWRRETGLDRPDEGVNTPPSFVTGINISSGAPRDGTSGAYNVQEAYVEFDVPLLADLPGARALDLSAAVRHSDYNTFGAETTSKLGLAWRPVQDVLLRGTFSEGFRAPSILELFQGGRETNFQAVDPCNGGGAGLPGCAGVPESYNQNQFGAGLIRGVTGGNPDLLAETAETFSVGMVLTPSWARGMSFAVDWFKIDIEDAIAARNAQQIMIACANQGGANCNLVDRDPNTGEVLRLRQAVSNFTKSEVEGVDFTWRYSFDTSVGAFNLLLDAARLIHFVNRIPQPDGTELIEERAGLSDSPRSTLPHWKGSGALRWSRGPLEVGWRGRYIGSSQDIPNNPVNGGTVSSILYHDLQFVYKWDRQDASVTLGIDNVTDEAPPASRANNPVNFDIYTYDIRGTYGYLRLLKAF